MQPLPPGPTRDLDVEWRPSGLRCRLRAPSLSEPALDVIAEATFLWLFGTSLGLVGATAIGLACVVAKQPLEEPLMLAAATSLTLLGVLGLRGAARWAQGQLHWVVDLDTTRLTAERYLGPIQIQRRSWPLEEVRLASWSTEGLGVRAGRQHLLLRTDEHPADLRWLAGWIQRARRSRADFWRQVLGRPASRESLMALLSATARRTSS